MGFYLGSYGAYCGLNYQDSECVQVVFCNWKVFSISISILFIVLELSHHGKMPNNTPFFWQINVKNLMPQAYYMLCRKFPASYNKETARHRISFSEQIKISVTCRNCGTHLFEYHSHAPISRCRVSKMCSVAIVCLWEALSYEPDTHSNFKMLRTKLTNTDPRVSLTGKPKHITCYWGIMAYFISNKSTFYIRIFECVWGEIPSYDKEFRSWTSYYMKTIWCVLIQCVLIKHFSSKCS